MIEAHQTTFEYLGYQYRKNKTYRGKIYYRCSKYDSENFPDLLTLLSMNPYMLFGPTSKELGCRVIIQICGIFLSKDI
ncbi:hypothetical protein HZS_7604 [Henneguya salminicola]|nr:hypothetical protein HZS_7604 [Henneguya salminicola]